MTSAASAPGATHEDVVDDLMARGRHGERGAVGRLLSLVERGGDAAARVSEVAHRSQAGAPVVGLTGAPGVGKSSLVAALVADPRAAGGAVLAVDPSSPLSGGAILGDRVRVDASTPTFFRSLASRGQSGGLAAAVPPAVRLLDALGFAPIIIETVGVGQVEVEIAGLADTTVVVVTPEWGDSIQVSKAGLLEVADVFVVNKAERPRAEAARRDLETMLDLAHITGTEGSWRPPVVMTVATLPHRGIDDIWAEVARHREHLAATGTLRERQLRRARTQVQTTLAHLLEQRGRDVLDSADGAALVAAVDRGEVSIDEAARRLFANATPS
jgi:LAO/AO transport system kinase